MESNTGPWKLPWKLPIGTSTEASTCNFHGSGRSFHESRESFHRLHASFHRFHGNFRLVKSASTKKGYIGASHDRVLGVRLFPGTYVFSNHSIFFLFSRWPFCLLEIYHPCVFSAVAILIVPYLPIFVFTTIWIYCRIHRAIP